MSRKQVGQRRLGLSSIVDTLKQYPLLCLGFTLYWTWILVTLQGPLRFPFYDLWGLPLPSWGPPLLVGALVLLIMASMSSLVILAVKRVWFVSLAAFSMFFGLVISALWVLVALDVLAETLLYSTGAFFMGVGSAMLILCFMNVYRRLGVRISLYHGMIAMLGATFYQFVIAFFGIPFASMFLVPCFPLIIGFCVYKSMKALPREPNKAKQKVAIKDARWLWLTLLLQGLVFGLGLGFLANWGEVALTPQVIASLCAGVASVMLLLTALTFKANFIRLVYLVGFPIVAVGVLLMALGTEMLVVGMAALAVGSCYLYMVFICLFVYLEKVLAESIVQIAGLGLFFLYAGQVIGGFLGVLLVFNVSPEFGLSTIVIPVGAFMLIVALYFSNSNRIESGWGNVQPGILGHERDILQDAARILATERNLSHRQLDVLILAAQGRTKRRISQKLFISEETAKTHLRKIYQKCEVRTQQELIDAVRERIR